MTTGLAGTALRSTHQTPPRSVQMRVSSSTGGNSMTPSRRGPPAIQELRRTAARLRLMGGVSSVHQMVASSNKASLIGQEEAHKSSYLFRFPAPAHRLEVCHAPVSCCLHLLRKWCLDPAGADDIDSNSQSRIFHRRNLGQSNNPMLRCRVCGRSWQTHGTENGGHVDDGASAPIQHGGDFVLHAVENAI